MNKSVLFRNELRDLLEKYNYKLINGVSFSEKGKYDKFIINHYDLCLWDNKGNNLIREAILEEIPRVLSTSPTNKSVAIITDSPFKAESKFNKIITNCNECIRVFEKVNGKIKGMEVDGVTYRWIRFNEYAGGFRGCKFTQCYLDKKIYDLDEKVKKDIYSALFFCDDIQFLEIK